MIPKKNDYQTVSAIKSMLQKLKIMPVYSLNLEMQTVVAQEDDYSIDDLLKAAGTLSPERGRELLDEVNRSREEWDSMNQTIISRDSDLNFVQNELGIPLMKI